MRRHKALPGYSLIFFVVAISFDRIDWAFAGTSSSSLRRDGSDGQVQHSEWHHWVDSRTTEPEKVRDEGDMFPQPDGTTLERGCMVNPATGADTEYEELWRDLDILPVPVQAGDHPLKEYDPESRCLVLQLQDDEKKLRGMAIRLGQFCQGLLREGDRITVERWEWTEAAGWWLCFKVGDGTLPCLSILREDAVALHFHPWNVIEKVGI
jgi:Protein HRI1